jgi:hypothetical protein
MSTFTELWKERSKAIMKEIDEFLIVEKKDEVYLFLTEDGLDFEENFNILFVEIFQSSLSALMNKFENMQDKLMSFEFVVDEEEKILSSEELTEEQRKRTINIFSKIKEGIKQTEKVGKEISELYAELHSLTDDENNDSEEKGEENQNNNNEMKKEENEIQLDVLSRLIGCFVFSLYAYMDVYCMSLFQSIICCCSPENLFDVYERLHTASNPKKSVEALLKIISILNDEEEKEVLNIVNQRVNSITEWKERYESFKDFIKIRNKIAHKKPILDIEELKKKFPKLTEKTEEKIKEETLKFEEALSSQLIRISIADSIVKSFWENFVNLIYLREIGFESSIYLALIDRLIHEFLNDIGCFEENDE